MQRLYIANKNYSSWSVRAWLVLTAFDLDFEEILIRFDVEDPTFKQLMCAEKTGGFNMVN